MSVVTDEYEFEPKRTHRWALEIGKLKPFMITSVKHSAGKPDWSMTGMIGGDSLTVEYNLAETDDLEVPVDNDGKGVLKFFDSRGDVVDEYDISWSGMKHIPFLELQYFAGTPIVSRVILYRVRLKKRS